VEAEQVGSDRVVGLRPRTANPEVRDASSGREPTLREVSTLVVATASPAEG